MALEFGLFKREGLEQETGDLKERWGQGGSNIINFADSAVTDETIYTVTAGKTLYISSITMSNNSDTGSIQWLDGGSGGTLKFFGQTVLLDEQYVIDFKTPLQFNTDVYVTPAGADTYDINFTGWEE